MIIGSRTNMVGQLSKSSNKNNALLWRKTGMPLLVSTLGNEIWTKTRLRAYLVNSWNVPS